MGAGLYELIPGLKEAEERYASNQIEAFFGVEPSMLGGIEVLPFTPRMFVELDAAGNRFFSGGKPELEDVAMFLWRISPVYTRRDAKIRQDFIFGLLAALAGYSEDAIFAELYKYFQRSWCGMPMFRRSVRGGNSPSTWVSCLVHMLASQYGWTEDYILDLPFRRLWQYANRILEDKDPKYKERISEVEDLKARYLATANSGSN